MNRLFILSFFFGLFCSAKLSADDLYDFKIIKSYVTMSDGVKLALTAYSPVLKVPEEKFPVLLEILPYRKDDFFAMRDYQNYSYFAKRGYLTVKVDIRGTGGSDGMLPDREYSDQEIKDVLEIIDILAKRKDSNGNVGMWGISWSGFNAIQVRSQKPKALKAIIAVHASDDLFYDDVHYIDGILHIDSYAVGVELDAIFPKSPSYQFDVEYFENRFNRYPWILTYLKNQRDGEFWSKKSRRFDKTPNSIPMYLVGGLLDGYRDTVIRRLEAETGTIQAEIGPWNHDYPDTGNPGPKYNWRQRAVQWWDRWLRQNQTPKEEKSFVAFVRQPSIDPGDAYEGEWKNFDLRKSRADTFYLGKKSKLQSKSDVGEVFLKYHPQQGVAAGNWWGEITGDMAKDDQSCEVFDSPVLTSDKEMVGTAEVQTNVASDSPQVHWVARLEDVFPDGKVSLVTGGALNISQRTSRTNPSLQKPNGHEVVKWPLRFSTWVFKPGHKIRLSLCNGQFPMFWPTPHQTNSKIILGDQTWFKLPGISGGNIIDMPAAEPEVDAPFGKQIQDLNSKTEISTNPVNGETTVTWRESEEFEIDQRNFKYECSTKQSVMESQPENAKFFGKMEASTKLKDEEIKVVSRFTLDSSKEQFKAKIQRSAYKNGKLIKEKNWMEVIPRDFQ